MRTYLRAATCLFVLIITEACALEYVPSRVTLSNVEKAGDVQVDLSLGSQATVSYALSDQLFLGAHGRTYYTENSGWLAEERADIRGGGLHLGYQRRLKHNRKAKYSLSGGLALESWTGKGNFNEASADIIAFDTMIALPHLQASFGVGDRYTGIHGILKASYLEPLRSEVDEGLTFDHSAIIEGSVLGHFSIIDRLSFFGQFTVNRFIARDEISYSVAPWTIRLGLSFSFGSEGSFEEMFERRGSEAANDPQR